MKVCITGGTGFVGREIIRQLLNAGHQVRALQRAVIKSKQIANVEYVIGDTTSAESLSGCLSDCEAVIHLVGIIREFPGKKITFERLHTESTRNIVNAAEQQGVKRFLHMSANGTRPEATTAYHKTKWAAEQQVRASQLDWTIFRPSLIYGAEDQFVNMLADLIRKLPVVPVIGDGQYQLQPVSVTDVAAGFIRALETSETFGQTFCCCGPQAYSYDEIIDMITAALGKTRRCKLHHPLLLMRPIINIMQGLPQFPITGDQLQMLLDGNCCPDNNWHKELDIELTPFTTGISYLS